MNITLALKNRLLRYIARASFFHRHYCVMCESYVGKFLPYRIDSKKLPPLMRALDAVGSDIDNFSCPKCNCHDRERHLFLYLKHLNILKKFQSARILHFAPEEHLSKVIRDQEPLLYVRADLFPTMEDIQCVDMMNMPFESESFDFVIANHVLEHVDDFHKGLSEINRVLKKGGYAILQTPYSRKLHGTFSDKGIDDDLSRLHAYGQQDHVRLFGSNIFDEISSSGLINHVNYHEELLRDISAGKYGVNSDEPLFLFQRPI